MGEYAKCLYDLALKFGYVSIKQGADYNFVIVRDNVPSGWVYVMHRHRLFAIYPFTVEGVNEGLKMFQFAPTQSYDFVEGKLRELERKHYEDHPPMTASRIAKIRSQFEIGDQNEQGR